MCLLYVAISVFFYAKIKSEREVVRMFSDEVREKILSKEELQQYQQIKNKIDNSIKQRLANIAMLSNK